MIGKVLLSVFLGFVGYAWVWLYNLAAEHQGRYLFVSLLVVSSLGCRSRRKAGADHA